MFVHNVQGIDDLFVKIFLEGKNLYEIFERLSLNFFIKYVKYLELFGNKKEKEEVYLEGPIIFVRVNKMRPVLLSSPFFIFSFGFYFYLVLINFLGTDGF